MAPKESKSPTATTSTATAATALAATTATAVGTQPGVPAVSDARFPESKSVFNWIIEYRELSIDGVWRPDPRHRLHNALVGRFEGMAARRLEREEKRRERRRAKYNRFVKRANRDAAAAAVAAGSSSDHKSSASAPVAIPAFRERDLSDSIDVENTFIPRHERGRQWTHKKRPKAVAAPSATGGAAASAAAGRGTIQIAAASKAKTATAYFRADADGSSGDESPDTPRSAYDKYDDFIPEKASDVAFITTRGRDSPYAESLATHWFNRRLDERTPSHTLRQCFAGGWAFDTAAAEEDIFPRRYHAKVPYRFAAFVPLRDHMSELSDGWYYLTPAPPLSAETAAAAVAAAATPEATEPEELLPPRAGGIKPHARPLSDSCTHETVCWECLWHARHPSRLVGGCGKRFWTIYELLAYAEFVAMNGVGCQPKCRPGRPPYAKVPLPKDSLPIRKGGSDVKSNIASASGTAAAVLGSAKPATTAKRKAAAVPVATAAPVVVAAPIITATRTTTSSSTTTTTTTPAAPPQCAICSDDWKSSYDLCGAGTPALFFFSQRSRATSQLRGIAPPRLLAETVWDFFHPQHRASGATFKTPARAPLLALGSASHMPNELICLILDYAVTRYEVRLTFQESSLDPEY